MCLAPRDEATTATTTGHNNMSNTADTTNHKRFSRPTLLPRRRYPVAVEDDDDDRVTFREQDNQIHVIPTAVSCLGEDQDRQTLFYTRDNIKEFRRQAQVLSKKCRDYNCSSMDSDSDDSDDEDDDERCTRGLELRMSLQRQDRKHMVVQRILKAQDEDCASSDELAHIASQYSVWSRKLAVAQAHKDYYAAYHPNLLASTVLPEMPVPVTSSSSSCSRELITKKRSSSLFSASSSTAGRRVRIRMF